MSSLIRLFKLFNFDISQIFHSQILDNIPSINNLPHRQRPKLILQIISLNSNLTISIFHHSFHRPFRWRLNPWIMYQGTSSTLYNINWSFRVDIIFLCMIYLLCLTLIYRPWTLITMLMAVLDDIDGIFVDKLLKIFC